MKKMFYAMAGVGGVGLLFLFVAFFFASPKQAGANPQFISSVASSSESYMTPGTATTTLTHNAFSNSGATIPKKLGLSFIVHASSSPTAFDYYVEESDNNNTWYGKRLSSNTVTVGQTTVHLSSSTPSFRLVPSATTTSEFATEFATYEPSLQYVRVSSYIPAGTGSGNGSVGIKISPLKEGSY
mgnify:CR=1 FL=1